MKKKHVNIIILSILIIQTITVIALRKTENTLQVLNIKVDKELKENNIDLEENGEGFYKDLIRRAIEGDIGIYSYLIDDDITLYNYTYFEWEFYKYFYNYDNSEIRFVELYSDKTNEFYIHDIYNDGEKYIIFANEWFLYDEKSDKLDAYYPNGGFVKSIATGIVYSGKQNSAEDTRSLTYYNEGNKFNVNLVNHHNMVDGGEKYYSINNIKISEEQYNLFVEVFDNLYYTVPYYTRDDIWINEGDINEKN